MPCIDLTSQRLLCLPTSLVLFIFLLYPYLGLFPLCSTNTSFIPFACVIYLFDTSPLALLLLTNVDSLISFYTKWETRGPCLDSGSVSLGAPNNFFWISEMVMCTESGDKDRMFKRHRVHVGQAVEVGRPCSKELLITQTSRATFLEHCSQGCSQGLKECL